ncbi:MAG: YtxH domain-containing protein [Candidatus Promineofilum sp.]|nr:YtxH domain-containing protein [Promineifilum sp.]MBP9657685.1 YtxH domain-containing protein [Promineifilum sp.]
MNKAISFMAGAVCGALIGAVTALLLTPASGSDLLQSAEERWELTKNEARNAMEERRAELEGQYRSARNS